MKNPPSDYFVAAVLRGYDAEVASGRRGTLSGIWDRVCIECMMIPDGFRRAFEWDTPRRKVNRIGTIRDCIAAGLVPGLRLTTDDRGYLVVVKDGTDQRKMLTG